MVSSQSADTSIPAAHEAALETSEDTSLSLAEQPAGLEVSVPEQHKYIAFNSDSFQSPLVPHVDALEEDTPFYRHGRWLQNAYGADTSSLSYCPTKRHQGSPLSWLYSCPC